MKIPTALSEETLAKAWNLGLPEGEAGREEFPEHGDSWFTFRLEAL